MRKSARILDKSSSTGSRNACDNYRTERHLKLATNSPVDKTDYRLDNRRSLLLIPLWMVLKLPRNERSLSFRA